MAIYGLAIIGISYMVAYAMVPIICSMLTNAKFVRPNFRGELIPLGVGLVFPVTLIISSAIWIFLMPIYIKTTLLFLFAVVSMALLGLIDDVFGSRDATGLKGHFKQLVFNGELTTGAFKALGGGIIAFLISLTVVKLDDPVSIIYVFLNALIIAFSTNAINLLDLRPGRAIKGYLIFAVVLFIIGSSHAEIWLLAMLTGAVLGYMPFDLKAKAMMGDTGSNVLGIVVGLMAVLTLPVSYKFVYFIFLIVFHIYTEKYSLTKVIEKNRVLNYLDMIGRK